MLNFPLRWTLRKYFSILNFEWWIFVWSMLNSWCYNHKLCASSLIPFLSMTKGEKSDDLYHFDSMTYIKIDWSLRMSYMPCKILENITRLIDHIESMPYIDIMKFMLKIFISYRSKNCPISFDLWFSSKFRIYYCLMRITISSTVRTYRFMLEFNGWNSSVFIFS